VRRAGWGALAATILLWSSSYAVNRAVLRFFQPGHVALLRYVVASLALAAVAFALRVPMPERRDWPRLLGLGFLGVTLYNTALAYGLVRVSAGAASLIIASEGIYIALLATILLGERLGVTGWLGSVLSFAGVVLIVLGEGRDVGFEPHALYVVVAAISTSAFFVLQKPMLRRYAALPLTAYCLWGGTALMLPFGGGALDALRAAPLSATVGLLYLGVFPAAVGYVTWAMALDALPAFVAGNALYLIPPLAAAIAFAWLREAPSWLTAAGGAVTLTGVALVNRRAPAPRRTSQPNASA
jgi:drug/metabolite transporter (DMT)-like permease